MRRLLYASTVLGVGLLVASCATNPAGPSPLTSTDALVTALRQEGATVRRGEALPNALPCWSANGRVVFVNAGSITAFEYATTTAADQDAANVSADGSGITATGCTTVISWVGPPHFYRRDRLIVLYAGAADDILRPLATVLGSPFASR